MRLFRDKSQVTSKCSRNKKLAHEAQPGEAHFWVFFDLLLYCVVLCCTVLCCVVLYCAVLCCANGNMESICFTSQKTNCVYPDVIHGSVLQ